MNFKHLTPMLILTVMFMCVGCGKPKEALKITYCSNIYGNFDVVISDVEGMKPQQITNRDQRDGYPAVSPDGKTIAFYGYYGRETWSIHTINVDGSERKRLTHEENKLDSSPSWTPDGKQILFARVDGEEHEIWIMNADGSQQKQIEGISGGGPNITKAGRLLYYSHFPNKEICIADIDGSNSIALTSNDTDDANPDMSPDGTKIAFMSDRDGSIEIYTMGADGSNQTRLTFEGANWDPIWSPDGTRILFNGIRDGNNDIFVMNSDGSSVINITDNDASNTQPRWVGR